ncbi:SDR family oxidoreductase [candidate division CSSED10-310 bacterium]|uniref:SDR family oxidoreductase n=1 Tax=candidate division CSSED10-310 bacterium TaxID=2855610 RepID=A0ABV6YR19_UNCC1
MIQPVADQNKIAPSSKIALVTGASRGIGREVAVHLGKCGYAVVINYKDHGPEAEAAVTEINKAGGQAIALQADVSVLEEVASLFQHIVKEFEELHIIINNVGPYLFRSILDTDPVEWDHIIRSNLYSSYYCCFHGFPLLKAAGWGRIINMSCAAVQYMQAEPKRTPYRIAKTGVLLLARSLATELARYNITVNTIAPGIVDNGAYSEEFRAKIVEDIPVRRLGTATDVIQVLDFLLQPQSDYITGTCIEVAGGWRL